MRGKWDDGKINPGIRKASVAAIILMIAKSDPKEKDIMVNLVMSIVSLIDHKLFLQADI